MRSRLTLALGLLLASGAAHAETRRFAIILGNNSGTADLAPLRYAESDAGKMARVLAELGDVPEENLLLLQGRPLSDLEKAIVHVREAVSLVHRAPDERAVLIFYFSGHSDGESIEMGRERLTYSKLKAMLAGTGAELRVEIIDACRSGSAILQKGGRPAPPFTIHLADQLSASGDVIITSSAADESALESSEVMGSYFTHNLVSGLRGAADTSGDKQVTLAEAYRYAYDHTVSETAVAPTGAQHPAYDYRLSGQGELVLASLQQTSAVMELPAGADRALVTDLARDQVVAEVLPGSGRLLALEPGSYGVKAIRGGESYGGRFTLADGQTRSIRWSELNPLQAAEVALKGGGEVSARVEPAPSSAAPWLIGASVGATGSVLKDVGVSALARVSYESSTRSGFTVAALGSTGSASSGASESSLQVRGGWRAVWDLEPVALSLGGEAGLGWMSQSLPGGSGGSAMIFNAGPRATARLHLTGPVWAGVAAELPLTLAPVDGNLQLVALPSASAELLLGL